MGQIDKLYSFTMDCIDPQELAAFYTALLGWEVPSRNGEYAIIAPSGLAQGAYPGIIFQRNPDYVAPVWPSGPREQQQVAHIDIAVNDLDKADAHVFELGATFADTQFADDWRVLSGPAGHPFCLCLIKNVFTAGE